MKNYLRKLIIMFVMAFAVIGIGAVQNGVIANAATVGSKLTSSESGWIRYDDNNSRIVYSSNVGSLSLPSQAVNNCVKVMPFGNTAKFKFYGTQFRIIGINDPVNQSSKTQVKIDGNIMGSVINQRVSPWNNYIINYESYILANSLHEVTIENLDSGYNNCNFILDAIDIRGNLWPYYETISLNKSTMELTEDTSEQLIATTTPAALGVTWNSSDKSVATVDLTGKVTAVKEGQATITAAINDGSYVTTSCAVTVVPKETDPKPESTESENIVNIAHAKGDNTNNAGGGVTIIFKGLADTTLSVVKTADVQSVYVGDTFTYTIVVTNTGSKKAKAVVFNDSAPNHIDFLVNGVTATQGKIDPSSTSKNITVNVGDIPPLGTVTIKIPSTVII